MVEKKTIELKDSDIDPSIALQKDIPSKNREIPPGSGLSLAVAFWLWGIMVSYFPIYSGIPSEWYWPFRGLGYAFYGLGAVAAIFGLSNLTNSRFLQYVGTALAFGVVAYLFHLWASNVGGFGWSLLLRFIVFMSAAVGLLYLLLAIPYLFLKPQNTVALLSSDSDSREALNKAEAQKPARSRFEQIVGIIIALLALLTAFAPIIKTWFKIQE